MSGDGGGAQLVEIAVSTPQMLLSRWRYSSGRGDRGHCKRLVSLTVSIHSQGVCRYCLRKAILYLRPRLLIAFGTAVGQPPQDKHSVLVSNCTILSSQPQDYGTAA
jgi:hypothetical protein